MSDLTVAEIIENIFVAHISEIEAIKTAYTYEPATVDRALLPLVTMFFLLPESQEAETGLTEDVDYRWETSVYISLTDFKNAQTQMRNLSQQIVANFRQHRQDYTLEPSADLFGRSLRRRNPPTPAEDGSYLRASWELRVSAGEQ